MLEQTYQNTLPSGSRLAHHYGPNVHILSDAWALSAVARLGHPDTSLPNVHQLLIACYRRLLHAACEQLPQRQVVLKTRMTESMPDMRYSGVIIDPESTAIVVDIARGGMIPGHLFQVELMGILTPDRVRVDHIYMQRRVNPDTGSVEGVDFYGSKIGGPVQNHTLFIPDPMGATGASVCHVMDRYKNAEEGAPRKMVTCHLILTPEYLKKSTTAHPNAAIYALRLDRGASPPEILETAPGLHWDQESGLSELDYIVPGAGGLGEVINNAFV